MRIVQRVCIIDPVDPSSAKDELRHHFVVDILKICCAHHSFSYAPLIGHDDDAAKDGGEGLQRFLGLFVKNEFFVVEDIAAFLLYVDDAVPVEEEGPVLIYFFHL